MDLGRTPLEALRVRLPRLPLLARGDRGSALDRLERFGGSKQGDERPPTVIPFPAPRPVLRPTPPAARPAVSPPPPPSAVDRPNEDRGAASLRRIRTQADADEMAQQAARGDLWLRLSDFEAWPDRRARRETVIDAVAAHPEWSDPEVYRVGLALALWDYDGAYPRHRARNRKRVRRLRAAAIRNVVHLDAVRARRAVEPDQRADGPHTHVA